MVVEIVDLNNVKINEENFGAPIDAAVNNINLAPAIQIALQQWWQSKQQAFNDEKAQLALQQQQAVEAAIANANAQNSAEIASYQAQIATLTAELDALKNPPKPAQNWIGLANDLLVSPLFYKVRGLADQSIPLSNAYTDLCFSMFATQNWEGFLSSVALIRSALSILEADFTAEELSLLDQILGQNGFSALPK
jgi:hypothetical protein